MNLKEDAMLEKVDLTKKISKEEYKAKMPQMEIELGRLQRLFLKALVHREREFRSES